MVNTEQVRHGRDGCRDRGHDQPTGENEDIYGYGESTD